MKRSLLAMAALTAFTGLASAQSSVTAFGIVDLAARSVKNGSAGTINQLISGGQATSRIGFRGVEDLGGGLRAGFWLEGQVDADTGGTSLNWQRRSTVSLIGGFGEIRLGRDQNPTFTNFIMVDSFGLVGVATPKRLRDPWLQQGGAATDSRASNTIAYLTPSMGGLYAHLMVGAGEGAAASKYMGGRVGYAAGPLNISGAYGLTEDVTVGTVTDDLTVMNVAATFNAGFATFGLFYEKDEHGANDRTLTSLSVSTKLGNGTLKAQYTNSDSSIASFDSKSYGIGYVYDLSKRTSLYGTFGVVDNGNGAKQTVATPPATTAMRNGEKSTGYDFGIRHNF